MVRKVNAKELYIYIQHDINVSVIYTEEDDIDGGVAGDVIGGGVDDGWAADDDDIERKDNEDVEEDELEGEQEPVILIDFEDSDPEGPELYNTIENQQKATAKARENVMSQFGSAASICRQTEENIPLGGDDSDDQPSMDERDEEGVDNQMDRCREFHEEDLTAGKRLRLVKGIKFRDLNLFRKGLSTFGIQNGFAHTFIKNDKKWVIVKCVGTHCSWRIHMSKENEGDGFQIKTFTTEHCCGTHYTNKRVTAKWVGTQYLEKIRDTPNLITITLIEEVK